MTLRVLRTAFVIAVTITGATLMWSATAYALVGSQTSTSTSPSSASIVLGSSVSDYAVVTGVSDRGSPKGTVTFYVCAPNPKRTRCYSTGEQVGQPRKLKPGPGPGESNASSAPFTPTSTGTWCFSGRYSGDEPNWGPSKDASTGECVQVTCNSLPTTCSHTETLPKPLPNAAGGRPTLAARSATATNSAALDSSLVRDSATAQAQALTFTGPTLIGLTGVGAGVIVVGGGLMYARRRRRYGSASS
jgi:hypothetical protein